MILSVHTIAGVTLASLVPDKPLIGFTLGFFSHYLLDSLPHTDYDLKSLKRDEHDAMNKDMIVGKDFYIDLFKISLDATAGLLVSYLIFGFYLKYSILVILAGATGGMLPDLLHFIYMKTRREPFVTLQRFHLFMDVNKGQ